MLKPILGMSQLLTIFSVVCHALEGAVIDGPNKAILWHVDEES